MKSLSRRSGLLIKYSVIPLPPYPQRTAINEIGMISALQNLVKLFLGATLRKVSYRLYMSTWKTIASPVLYLVGAHFHAALLLQK